MIAIITVLNVVFMLFTETEESLESFSDSSSIGIADSIGTADVDSSTAQEEQIIYEDQYIRAVFLGVDALPFIDGMSAVKIRFENLSEEEITVLPMDSSVNDTMVQFTSGTPATMQGKKKLNYVMSFNNEIAGISDFSQITKLEFSLSVNNAQFHEISRSKILTVEIH